MACETIRRSRVAARDVALGSFADELINAALGEPGGKCHVVATQRVTERPGMHEAVTHGMPVSNLVLRLAQLAHVILLDLGWDTRDRMGRSQLFVWEALIAVRLRHAANNKLFMHPALETNLRYSRKDGGPAEKQYGGSGVDGLLWPARRPARDAPYGLAHEEGQRRNAAETMSEQ